MGFPDFWDVVPVSSTGKKASFDISDLTNSYNSKTGMIGVDSHDFKLAVEKLKIDFADEISNGSVVINNSNNYKVHIDGKEYTWHHHQDCKTMQLVETSVHSACGNHVGGRQLAQKGKFGVFPSPDLVKLLKCK